MTEKIRTTDVGPLSTRRLPTIWQLQNTHWSSDTVNIKCNTWQNWQGKNTYTTGYHNRVLCIVLHVSNNLRHQIYCIIFPRIRGAACGVIIIFDGYNIHVLSYGLSQCVGAGEIPFATTVRLIFSTIKPRPKSYDFMFSIRILNFTKTCGYHNTPIHSKIYTLVWKCFLSFSQNNIKRKVYILKSWWY